MKDFISSVAAWLWLLLGILVCYDERKWNQKFGELYDELKQEIEEDRP